MNYMVDLSLDGTSWVADVVDLPGAHTFTRSLTSLDAAVREVIALVEDLEEGAENTLDITYRYDRLPAVVKIAAELGAERAANERVVQRIHAETADRARELIDGGYSVRDIAGLLKISPGRVSQIMKQRMSA